MSFNALLLFCSSHKTSIGESGIRVTMQPNLGERIVFFDLKNETQPGGRLYDDWNLKSGATTCDGLIFYMKDDKRVFCLIELKSSDLNHAADQLINTYEIIESSLKTNLRGQSFKNYSQLKSTRIIWKAYACYSQHITAPRNKTRLLEKLKKKFDDADISDDGDIGKFLRKR